MEKLIANFKQAQVLGSGPQLAATITPDNLNLLHVFHNDTNHHSVQQDINHALNYNNPTGFYLSKTERNAWAEIYASYWKVAGELLKAEDGSPKGDWRKVFTAWKEVANTLIRGYSSHGFQSWTVPCLYVVGRYLRIFAIKADAQAKKKGAVTFNAGFQDDVVGGFGNNENLEEAARVINRIFTLCISDRAPPEESRKWGLYYTTGLLFKTYFKLNSIGLCKNIIRALGASVTDMPALEQFPKSHVVTFKYYLGVIYFLEEDYLKAEENLMAAWNMCHKDAHKNRELILTYLVPCRLLTTHTLPTPSLIAPYPRLAALFTPLGSCIRRGDLAGFDEALKAGEDEFVKRRIYLTLERGRDIATRNLFRKVFVAGGFETPKDGGAPIRRTRVPVAEFAAALRVGKRAEESAPVDMDEVECLLANMIYKNLMKGYIARERGIVVLSKNNSAFPGTGV
ncbi:MAG: COP9 signalosome (CSN) subunit [Cirrosporium novae-zelandiae]|nr:MAG: COP9 signalosome (CSN) subunit [Cirrosporium novae-zelandiae]